MTHGTQLVFVEVRYRARSDYGGAAASVGRLKRQRIWRAAMLWLQAQPVWQHWQVWLVATMTRLPGAATTAVVAVAVVVAVVVAMKA